MIRSLALILLLCLASCSFFEHSTEVVEEYREPPVDVSVGQTDFSESGLQVMVQLRPRTALATENIAVGIFGLENGVQIEQQVVLLKDALGDQVLEPEETYEVPLRLHSSKISEYQVKCSWGEEVQRLVENTIDTPANTFVEEAEEEALDYEVSGTPGLLLAAVKVEKEALPCTKPPCDMLFYVNADLMNNTPSSIAEIRLALGLFWVNDGESLQAPVGGEPLAQNEEEIMLAEVSLEPGQAKRIRVKVDRAVPPVPGGRFTPHLRVLDYEASLP